MRASTAKITYENGCRKESAYFSLLPGFAFNSPASRRCAVCAARRNRLSVSNSESSILLEYYFIIFLFGDYLIWRKLFSRDFYPDAGIPTFVQKDRPKIGSRKRPLVQACYCSTSSHTEWNLVIIPRVPRIATFNSRSQFRAMLNFVAHKTPMNSFFASPPWWGVWC